MLYVPSMKLPRLQCHVPIGRYHGPEHARRTNECFVPEKAILPHKVMSALNWHFLYLPMQCWRIDSKIVLFCHKKKNHCLSWPETWRFSEKKSSSSVCIGKYVIFSPKYLRPFNPLVLWNVVLSCAFFIRDCADGKPFREHFVSPHDDPECDLLLPHAQRARPIVT